MMYMRNVLDDSAIPGDAKISIECQVPNTSKRIDFIITRQTEDATEDNFNYYGVRVLLEEMVEVVG
jgi:hypothetical protein